MTHQPSDGEMYDNALEEEYSKPFYMEPPVIRHDHISCGNCSNTVTKHGDYCKACLNMFKRDKAIHHDKCDNCGHLTPVDKANQALADMAEEIISGSEEPARDVHDGYMSCIQCNDVLHESYFVGPHCGACAAKRTEKAMKKTMPVRVTRTNALADLASWAKNAIDLADNARERCYKEQEGEDRPKSHSLDREDREIRTSLLKALASLEQAWDTQSEPEPKAKAPSTAEPAKPGKVIVVNKAKCLGCNTVVISKYRHDYRKCSCGALVVDGGTDYLRRGGDPNVTYEELSEYAPS